MIIAIIIIFITLILHIILAILGIITFVLPFQIATAIQWLFSSVGILNGWFPVQTLMKAMAFLITFFLFFYGIKIVFWIISFIPGIGHKDLPKMSQTDVLDLREQPAQNRNVLNFRRWKSGNKGRRNISMKDIR